MNGIRDAFGRVKEDIDSLKQELNFLRNNLTETREKLIDVCDILVKVNDKTDKLSEQDIIIQDYLNKLNNKLDNLPSLLSNSNKISSLDNSLDKQTHFPTENKVLMTNNPLSSTGQTYINPRKAKFKVISTGNEGVQTNRQTYKQTDIRQENSSYNQEKTTSQINFNSQKSTNDSVNLAGDLLDSLDSIKKELRLKFKRLTDQELTVFSTIYQLEEEFGYSDYKSISKKLNLSESSIRDYVRRLMNKQIPLTKEKINNKEIHLFISPNLKKIASLNTILELRDI
jgi:hypothetical protein